ncbi:MAG: Uma2 family endonuclease [bacterium]|nr:Uma2 family endonuclease [bacterium]MCY3924729.1 Uma2 family endonuclease [bacterium]
MSDVLTRPEGTDIEYPEGPQVPEGDLHTLRRCELYSALREWMAEHPRRHSSWVGSNINVYYRRGDPAAVVCPDVVVAFGIDPAAVRGQPRYRVWDAGAPPAFVLEVASPSTADADLHDKPARYAELGVAEYWRFDPTGGDLLGAPLQGEARRRGRWEPIAVTRRDGTLTGRSGALGLELRWQPPRLRLYDPAAHAWLHDHHDERQARQTAEEGARAAEERARAAEAELAALRRRLGHDPSP